MFEGIFTLGIVNTYCIIHVNKQWFLSPALPAILLRMIPGRVKKNPPLRSGFSAYILAGLLKKLHD
jgi:hypothetical protein